MDVSTRNRFGTANDRDQWVDRSHRADRCATPALRSGFAVYFGLLEADARLFGRFTGRACATARSSTRSAPAFGDGKGSARAAVCLAVRAATALVARHARDGFDRRLERRCTAASVVVDRRRLSNAARAARSRRAGVCLRPRASAGIRDMGDVIDFLRREALSCAGATLAYRRRGAVRRERGPDRRRGRSFGAGHAPGAVRPMVDLGSSLEPAARRRQAATRRIQRAPHEGAAMVKLQRRVRGRAPLPQSPGRRRAIRARPAGDGMGKCGRPRPPRRAPATAGERTAISRMRNAIRCETIGVRSAPAAISMWGAPARALTCASIGGRDLRSNHADLTACAMPDCLRDAGANSAANERNEGEFP